LPGIESHNEIPSPRRAQIFWIAPGGVRLNEPDDQPIKMKITNVIPSPRGRRNAIRATLVHRIIGRLIQSRVSQNDGSGSNRTRQVATFIYFHRLKGPFKNDLFP